jgi:hypothetical protein
MAELIADGEARTLDLAAFAPARLPALQTRHGPAVRVPSGRS